MVMKMAKISVRANPIFKPVHQSKKRYVVLKGSAGSGKSVDTAQQYILRIMNDKGRNLLCVRKSEVTNRDSTFAELVSAINNMGLSVYFKVTMSPLMIRCINGNSIIFRGVNDEKQREKLKSITFPVGKLTDVWLEEATELTKNDFEIIDDRLRGELPKGFFYQLKLTFNPVSKNHWIKKDFFDTHDPNVLTHHSTYKDNRFIDKGYYDRMERRRLLDPQGYQIYGLGDWGELKGLVFQENTNFFVEDISQNHDDYDDTAYGQDFGWNHAYAILDVAIKDDELYVLREIYKHEHTTGQMIALGKKAEMSRNIEIWSDSAEPDRIQEWNDAGYWAKPVVKEKGSVMAQLDWLKERKIHIHPSCVNLIKELQQYKWKYDDKRDLHLDEPVSIFDDAIAALRYGIEGWRKAKQIEIINKDEAFYGGYDDYDEEFDDYY